MGDKISEEISVKSIEDLARALTRCKGNFSFLVGAGTSKAAGIKTSVELIEQWRSEEYMATNTEKKKEDWIKEEKKNIPSYQNEYGFWFEERYTTREERRQFIKDIVGDADPTFEHIVLSSLMQEGYIPITLTPNFDDLIYDAFYLYHEKRPFLVDHNAIAPQFKITHEDPMIVKLHGDYLYDNLKNTASETSELEGNIENVLETTLNEYGLITLGYSGEDASIMEVLRSDEMEIPDYGLFWCARDKNKLSEQAEELLKKDNTFLIEIESSQEFFFKLYEELEELNVPTPVDILSRAQDRAQQLRDGILQVGGTDILVLASEYMRRGENENAIDLLDDAIDQEEGQIELLVQRARAYREQGDYDKSIGDYSKALDIIEGESTDELSAEVIHGGRLEENSIRHGRGLSRSRGGYYKKAIEDFGKLTESETDNPTHYTNLAEAQILSDDVESGINTAKIALNRSETPSDEANSLMQIIIGRIVSGEDYESEMERFKELCEEGFHSSWNFYEIRELLKRDTLEEDEKSEIKGLIELYENSPNRMAAPPTYRG